MSHLGNSFRYRRIEKGLGFGQLARQLGYKNLSGGCNRIQAFERGGKVRPTSSASWPRPWRSAPIRFAFMPARTTRTGWPGPASRSGPPVRPLLAAVYQRIELPDDALDPEAAGAFASDVARERKLRVCLVLSRRDSIWFDTEGRESGRSEATPECRASRTPRSAGSGSSSTSVAARGCDRSTSLGFDP